MILGRAHDLNPHQAYRIKKMKHELDRAESYSEWKEIALPISVTAKLIWYW